MRQYISAQADRQIPVGYSSADVSENIEQQANYFACGADQWARSDFFAFNDYSWCSPSSLERSGWSAKIETYSDYSLPMFLSEYGCITNQRTWGEVEALYSPEVTVAWSGGLAYEYTLEANGYGLVEGSGNNIQPNGDFRRLKQAFENTPNPTGDGNARTNTSPPQCPPESEEWEVSTTNLPVIPQGARKYMRNGAGKGPGLGGDESSHWMGEPSETSPNLSDGEEVSDNPAGTGSPSGGSSGNSTSGEDSENAAGSVSGASTALFAFALTAVVAFFA